MGSKEVIARLAADGFRKVHQAGSHQKWKKNGRSVTLAHPVRDIPVGTLRSIFRQAGWIWPK